MPSEASPAGSAEISPLASTGSTEISAPATEPNPGPSAGQPAGTPPPDRGVSSTTPPPDHPIISPTQPHGTTQPPPSRKRQISISGPTLDGEYPTVFGRFADDPVEVKPEYSRQCNALGNTTTTPLKISGIEVTGEFSLFEPPPPESTAEGVHCGKYSGTPEYNNMPIVCRTGTEMPPDEAVLCRLGVQFNWNQPSGNYSGTITISYSAVCTDDVGPLCKQVTDLSPTTVAPVTISWSQTIVLTACELTGEEIDAQGRDYCPPSPSPSRS